MGYDCPVSVDGLYSKYKCYKLSSATDKHNCVKGIYTCTVQSLYGTAHYKTDLVITRSCCPKSFYHGTLQRNYRKMTISFSYNSFVKLSLLLNYNRVLDSIPMDPKHYIKETAL